MDETRKSRIRRSDELSDYYAECTNSMINTSNETIRRLNELLVTASLAFLGIIIAVIGNSELHSSLVYYQKWLAVSGSASFIFATIFGVIEAMLSIRALKKAAPLYGELSNILGKGYLSKASDNRLGEIKKALHDKKNLKTGGKFLIAQVVFFLLGIVLISALVCSLLFWTKIQSL